MGKSEKEKSSRRKGVREAKRTRLDEASLWRALSTRDFNAFLLQVLHVARAPRAQPAFPPEFILFIVTTFGICTNEHFPSISNTLWSSGDPMTQVEQELLSLCSDGRWVSQKDQRRPHTSPWGTPKNNSGSRFRIPATLSCELLCFE